MPSPKSLEIAVIGAGVAGLSCGWLLSQAHEVTLYEADARFGGHANTVDAPGVGGGEAIPVDTGFIVYNEANYPNLTALFAHLGVVTKPAEMSFGVSLDGGALEYGSAHPFALLAQPGNAFNSRFWSMLRDLVRFYRTAPRALAAGELEGLTLGEWLDLEAYGAPFLEDHLLPQIGAIWSTSVVAARDYPAEALVRFFTNHGLLELLRRPRWRTVEGGSRNYVARLTAPLASRALPGRRVLEVVRSAGGVHVRDDHGDTRRFDQVVIASHADQSLRMLNPSTGAEREVLGAFGYSRNVAVLHRDPALMPRRRAAWSGWNHIGRRGGEPELCVTYWMNLLQRLPRAQPLFVTLNPVMEPAPELVVRRETYEHPLFDRAAVKAQAQLWSLQGEGGVWFCGAYFGAGFHEDALQAGLAVAEALGGVRRPWTVAEESGRIQLDAGAQRLAERRARVAA